MVKNKAVFLDRDGIIVIPEFRNGRSYAPRTLKNFKFYKSLNVYLKRLKKLNFINIVVTNQPDVQNGVISHQMLKKMNDIILDKFFIDDIEYCIHNSGSNCRRRKPNAGMLEDAAQKWNIDFSKSFIIGDRKSDIDAGKKIGVKTIFIDHDYKERKPTNVDFISESPIAGLKYIIKQNDDK